jgi:hypothetical protein
MQNPSVLTTLRNWKNDPISVRDAKCNRRTTPCTNATPQAPCTKPAWALQNSKAIGQKCEKPWENLWFAAERIGTELFDVFPMILKSSKAVIDCAKHRYFVRLARSRILTDPDVVRLIQEQLANVSC